MTCREAKLCEKPKSVSCYLSLEDGTLISPFVLWWVFQECWKINNDANHGQSTSLSIGSDERAAYVLSAQCTQSRLERRLSWQEPLRLMPKLLGQNFTLTWKGRGVFYICFFFSWETCVCTVLNPKDWIFYQTQTKQWTNKYAPFEYVTFFSIFC